MRADWICTFVVMFRICKIKYFLCLPPPNRLRQKKRPESAGRHFRGQENIQCQRRCLMRSQ